MNKKIWLFFFSFIAVLWVWASFADIIPDNAHYLNKCVMLENVEIDNYRVIARASANLLYNHEFYELKTGECIAPNPSWGPQNYYVNLYFLDKSFNIKDVTLDNIKNKGILIWELDVRWWYVNNSNPKTYEKKRYKISKNWGKYRLQLIKTEDSQEGINNYPNISSDWFDINMPIIPRNKYVHFFLARIVTVLIETILLFFIARIFRKKSKISYWWIIKTWVIASTVTLPLLWFVLPLFINDYGTSVIEAWYIITWNNYNDVRINNHIVFTIVWEALVTLIEIFIIKYWLKISRWKAILASIICNLCSYLIWLLVF